MIFLSLNSMKLSSFELENNDEKYTFNENYFVIIKSFEIFLDS